VSPPLILTWLSRADLALGADGLTSTDSSHYLYDTVRFRRAGTGVSYSFTQAVRSRVWSFPDR